jgi:phage/plasmid-like protein (TIGR03299 family)
MQTQTGGTSVYDKSGVSLALDPKLFTNAPMLKAATLIEGATSWRDAIDQAGMNFDVVKRPLTFRNDRNNNVRIPGFYATVRQDTQQALGIVKDRYLIVPNIVAGSMIDKLLDDGSVQIAGAGTFRNGATGFIFGRIPADVQVGGIDPLHAFIVISWSHDGTRPVSAATMYIRDGCANQLPMILNSRMKAAAGRYVFRHVGASSVLDGRIDEARTALNIAFTATTYFTQRAEALLKRPMSQIDAIRLTEELIPSPKEGDDVPGRTQARRDAITELFARSDNLENVRGTAWAYYNAVAEYADHVMPARETKLTSRDENRAVSVFDGQANRLKQRAMLLTAEFAA